MNSYRLFDKVDTNMFGLPECAGVYAVCVCIPYSHNQKRNPERIIYIGSSSNMRKRVMSNRHPYRLAFSRFDDLCVYTKSIITDNYSILEKQLIYTYKPLLNKSGKKER